MTATMGQTRQTAVRLLFTRESRMLRASLPSSGRLSVTLVSCIKTVQARITKSLLWAAPRSLVYRDKISCHWVQGSPRTRASKRGTPIKRRHFAVIGSNNVKTVADSTYMLLIITSTGDRLFGFINIDDLE